MDPPPPVKEDKEEKPMKVFPIFQKNYKPPVNPLRVLQNSLIESTSPSPKRRRKSLLSKTELPGLSQMVLDAGQKEIGPRLCVDCGLFYSPGDAQDEEEHRKAHSRIDDLFKITLWKDAETLHSFVDGGNVILVDWNQKQKGAFSRLKDFTAWVDSELGASGGGACDEKQRMFLYVLPTKRKNQVRILGSVTIEIVDPAKVVAYVIKRPSEETESSEESQKETTIMIGITRLWTDNKYRRKQIASRLCDMARFHSGIPGCIVPKDKLGILEPSQDGTVFMYHYTGGQGAMYSYK